LSTSPSPTHHGKKITEDDLHWGSCNPFSSFYTAYTQHSDAILEDIITRGYDVISTSRRTVTTGDGRTVPTLVVGLRPSEKKRLDEICACIDGWMPTLGKNVEYVVRWFRDSCEGSGDVEPQDQRVTMIRTGGRT
jgi:hypothetical protein